MTSMLIFDFAAKGDPTSSYSTHDMTPRVIASTEPSHYVKYTIRNILGVPFKKINKKI